MKWVLWSISVLVLLSGWAAPQPTSSQAPPSGTAVAEKPRPPKVGDWWEYKENPANPHHCSRWEFQGIKEGMHVFTCGNFISYSRDEDYNWVRTTHRSGRVLHERTPYWPAVSYPLRVGKEWELRATGFRVPKYRWTSDIRVKVTALEDVVVAAGKFKAFRIEAQEYWREIAGASGVYRATDWYAQDAHVTLKRVGSNPRWNFELISWQYEP